MSERTVTIPESVAKKAIDAIMNDPRRWPYGHHQHGRAEAIRALRGLAVTRASR